MPRRNANARRRFLRSIRHARVPAQQAMLLASAPGAFRGKHRYRALRSAAAMWDEPI
jgi:hypothetical protein